MDTWICVSQHLYTFGFAQHVHKGNFLAKDLSFNILIAILNKKYGSTKKHLFKILTSLQIKKNLCSGVLVVSCDHVARINQNNNQKETSKCTQRKNMSFSSCICGWKKRKQYTEQLEIIRAVPVRFSAESDPRYLD